MWGEAGFREGLPGGIYRLADTFGNQSVVDVSLQRNIEVNLIAIEVLDPCLRFGEAYDGLLACGQFDFGSFGSPNRQTCERFKGWIY